MIITATVKNHTAHHSVVVATNGQTKALAIPSKIDGQGLAINGGELLFLALATCFCNDLYREAAKRNMQIEQVDVTVTGAFGNAGEPASTISYRADIQAAHTPEEITDLIQYVDRIAEVHNTVRNGTAVRLQLGV